MTNEMTRHLEAQWDAFLVRWPLESLHQMTLRQYTQAGDKDSFCNWLEIQTEELGSIWGGSAFKFGVYSRRDQSAKPDFDGRRYSDTYAWLTKYGNTAETAFERVRDILVHVATAARRGDLEAIDHADLGTVTKWKVAFLYQDRTQPCVVPLYKLASLQSVCPPGTPVSCPDMHRRLMADRSDRHLLEYGQRLWSSAEQAAGEPITSDGVLSWLQGVEGLQAIKPATDKVAGFRLSDGRELALIRENKTPTLFLSPGPWEQSLPAFGGSKDRYPPERPRNSGLEANAPSLALGHDAVSVKVRTREKLVDLFEAYADKVMEDVMPVSTRVQGTTAAVAAYEVSGPLNQILFGPPGTGKTYATIDEALAILDPVLLDQHRDDTSPEARAVLKQRFDDLSQAGRIRFVTFHQSFSYEDFVEGLRAETDAGTGQIRYTVTDGVFKTLCEAAAAKETRRAHVSIDLAGRRIWKMSLGNTLGGDAGIYDACLAGSYVLLGYGGAINFQGCQSRLDVQTRFEAAGHAMVDPQNAYGVTAVTTFVTRMKIGDLVVVSDGNFKFRAIGEITGDYEFRQHPQFEDDYSQSRPVRWLRQYQPSLPHAELMNNQFSQMTLYELKPGSIDLDRLRALLGRQADSQDKRPFAVGDILGSGYEVLHVSDELLELKKPNGNRLPMAFSMLDALAKGVRDGNISLTDIRDKSATEKLPEACLEPFLVNGYNNLIPLLVERLVQARGALESIAEPADTSDARVLIIDEINRGNVSRVFGELITLLEPSKRAGGPEALSVTLPYSHQSFSVPDNVYLIGTMNTADRSLAGLDVALRRRFVFKEMLPRPELLEDVVVHDVNVGQLLRTLNQRIEALLDREHALGHAYFMPIKGLAAEAAQAKLAEVFANQVLPLLQEYFFDDWQRIQWVLNDHRKPNPLHRFVQSQALDAVALFGTEVNASPRSLAWRVNPAAFALADSYQGVIGVPTSFAAQDAA